MTTTLETTPTVSPHVKDAAERLEVMKALQYGVEIETVCLGRQAAANAVQSVVGGTVRYDGGGYDKWVVVMADGRKWTAMSDGSLRSPNGTSAEVVSPVLKWSDLEQVQAVVRALKTAGARVNDSCGIHVHVGVGGKNGDADLSAAQLGNLARLVLGWEKMIVKSLGVFAGRQVYCPVMANRRDYQGAQFMERMKRSKPATKEALKNAWYGSASNARYAEGHHYHDSRYTGLNLHSVFFRGTVEMRWFNGSLHAGEVKSYIQFSLALVAKAMVAKAMSAEEPEMTRGEHESFRWFLYSTLRMRSDEFKTARFHLLKKFPGASLRPEPSQEVA